MHQLTDATPCRHHRNCAEHATCLAGVRYGALVGEEATPFGKALLPGLPCWHETPLPDGRDRAVCPMRESR